MVKNNDGDGGIFRDELIEQLRALGFEMAFFDHLDTRKLTGLLTATLNLEARRRKIAAVVRRQVAALRRGAEVVVPDEGEATEAALFFDRNRSAFRAANSSIRSRGDFVRTFVHSGCRTFAEYAGRRAA